MMADFAEATTEAVAVGGVERTLHQLRSETAELEQRVDDLVGSLRVALLPEEPSEPDSANPRPANTSELADLIDELTTRTAAVNRRLARLSARLDL